MFRRVGALGTALVLLGGPPAAAICIDDVAQLEQQARELEAEDATLRFETREGELAMEREAGGAEPRESWFGAPSSLASAVRDLQDARTLAEEGDEDGCMGLVEEARGTLQALEP